MKSVRGGTNGTRHGLRFYARCAREAWRGSWAAANAWQLVLVLLLLSGAGWFVGLKPNYPDIPYSMPIGMGLFVSTAWFTVFLGQFVAAPSRLARVEGGLPVLPRPSTAPSMTPVLALPAPEPTPAALPPPDRPLLDRPVLLPPLLDLSSLDLSSSDLPASDALPLDQPILVPPSLDLSSLGGLPDNPPTPDPLPLDQPILVPPSLDLSSFDGLPDDPPTPDPLPLDRPLLVLPSLDLSSLDGLPDDPPTRDPLPLDRPLLLPPLLDLASLDLLPEDPPAPDLLPLDRPRADLPLPELHAEPQAPALSLARAARRPVLPTIDVRLLDQIYETTAVDTTGDRLPASRAYRARIANRGDQTVRRCQLFFCNPMNIQVVSGPFDLAPGEHRDLPALRVIDEADEPHALLYFLDAETWHVAQGQAAWLPEPGRFKMKVLSANAPPSALEVKLLRDAAVPFAWTLVEADQPDKAAGRRSEPGRRAVFT